MTAQRTMSPGTAAPGASAPETTAPATLPAPGVPSSTATTIGVGVDASVESSVALAWAVDRARHTGETIRLVTVVEEESGGMGAAYAREATREASARVAEVERCVRADAPGVTVDLEVVHGPVAWALGRAVGPEDLLVVGTHSTGPSGDRVLGSRSVQVAAAARCAVAVVPPLLGKHRSGIVVGVETVDDIEPLLAIGLREAALLDEDVVLVHCAARRGSDADRIVAAMARAAAHADAHARVTARGVVGEPVENLLGLSRHASILVLGRSRTPQLNPLGTTCHRVLGRTSSVVLVAAVGESVPSVDERGRSRRSGGGDDDVHD